MGPPLPGTPPFVHTGSGQTPVQAGGFAYQPEFPLPWVIWNPLPTQLWIGLDWAMCVATTLLNEAVPGDWICRAYVPAPSILMLSKCSPLDAPSIRWIAA